MNHQYILVSLKKYDAAAITTLVGKIITLDGVFKVGSLEWEKDAEVPPYFFVYVNEGVDLEPIATEIRKDSNVAEANEPPARYAL